MNKSRISEEHAAKSTKYMSVIFVCRKLFGNGGLTDTPCALYQHGCSAFICPLPSQKLIVNFPFEYHRLTFIVGKNNMYGTNLKMYLIENSINLNLFDYNA